MGAVRSQLTRGVNITILCIYCGSKSIYKQIHQSKKKSGLNQSKERAETIGLRGKPDKQESRFSEKKV